MDENLGHVWVKIVFFLIIFYYFSKTYLNYFLEFKFYSTFFFNFVSFFKSKHNFKKQIL
jgi:hypothetical protein